MAEKKEITKVDIPLKIGDSAVFEKTITETDVVLFGGLTGDYSQMHFNEEYMKKTMYGTRIAHGILTFAIGCTASTKIQEQVNHRFLPHPTDTISCVLSIRYISEIR